MQNDIRPARPPKQQAVAEETPQEANVATSPPSAQRQTSDKSFSRFVHAPVVEELHEISHIAFRPSVIAGASIITSLTILLALFMGSYVGFTVSPYLPVATLVLGALVGLLFEATTVVAQRLRA